MNAPDLFTSYWSNPALRHTDAVKVSISRGQPKWTVGFEYRRAMLLAPSRQTFDLEDDADFEAAYLAELEEIGVQKITDLLKKISDEEGGRDLALLCYEADPADCHRSMFAHWWFEQTGQVVEELQRCGSSQAKPRRAAQERLFDL